jgi:glutamate-1-semialdehyde 2,1-aminomutase
MAAAISSLKISEREGVAKQVLSKGKYFCDQLESVAKKQNFPLLMTGPPSMPYPFVEGDFNLFKIQEFCRFCAEEGLYFHPHHNWFISNAHTFESIDHSIKKASLAIDKLSQQSN